MKEFSILLILVFVVANIVAHLLCPERPAPKAAEEKRFPYEKLVPEEI